MCFLIKNIYFCLTKKMYSAGSYGGELRERQNVASSSIPPHLQNSGFDDVNLFDHQRTSNSSGSAYTPNYTQDNQHSYNQHQNVQNLMINEKFQNGSFLYNKRVVPLLFLSMIPVFALAGKR